jgi:hypothetical protein
MNALHQVVDAPLECHPSIDSNLTMADIQFLHRIPGNTPDQVMAIVGKLVLYASVASYDHVLMYRDREDIMALYQSSGGRRFTMAAVFDHHTKTWGTHS